ncbi:MAG: leucyl/phenylalanyl-tRNA--protein transferase [Planctomycetota bacterium]|nr:leucyl/phenylalanyl-tRNA--protein transferase [Planctomycetota bacterium]
MPPPPEQPPRPEPAPEEPRSSRVPPDPDNTSPELLLWAYGRGIFPMADPITGEMGWYSPDPRGIIPLAGFRVPRTLARTVRQGRFDIRSDTAFEAVMRACARPRSRDDLPWIDERLIGAYVGLHRLGHAHSVEAWREGTLVGGLYGVQVGAAFFGESMFVFPNLGGTNASKICLVHLVGHLRRRGFILLDTQFINPHLEQFGCIEISRAEYLRRLADAIVRPVSWGRLEPEAIGEAGTPRRGRDANPHRP